ncbi:MAG TPA: TfuA-like protein [Dongiaceae bacterium]|nr:TfuA-like protein [Dongiaceae bacterium]
MTVVVFAGPSLGHFGAAAPDLEFLPPAAEGDVYRVARRGPRAIALIDGFFEAQPAVWHKEILWAMSQGIHVLGAASMGALRAAELWSFGMVGVGLIYRGYRCGALTDDAEVAVVHGPAELGYPSLNEALVNVRATLSRARAEGALSPALRRLVLESARSVFYKDRTWERILAEAAANGMTGDDAARLKRWLKTGNVDLKRRDAQSLVRLLKERDFAEPMRASFQFETTTFWSALVDRHEPDAEETLRNAV